MAVKPPWEWRFGGGPVAAEWRLWSMTGCSGEAEGAAGRELTAGMGRGDEKRCGVSGERGWGDEIGPWDRKEEGGDER
ncbi:MAG: hypothetical protein ABSD48_14200 [Armatimonadota bacterium]